MAPEGRRVAAGMGEAMKPLMPFELRAQVDFLDLLQSVEPPTEKWEAIIHRLVGLKYVKQAWIDHTCVIEVHLQTSNFQAAERRLKKVIEKATRIVASYNNGKTA